jgi:hypothetical protein
MELHISNAKTTTFNLSASTGPDSVNGGSNGDFRCLIKGPAKKQISFGMVGISGMKPLQADSREGNSSVNALEVPLSHIYGIKKTTKAFYCPPPSSLFCSSSRPVFRVREFFTCWLPKLYVKVSLNRRESHWPPILIFIPP